MTNADSNYVGAQGLDVSGSNKAQTHTTHRETTVVKEE